MKKLQTFTRKIITLSMTSLTFLSTAALNQPTTNIHGLYVDNALIGHGFDAMSTKNGLNKPDKGAVSAPIITPGGTFSDDWEGEFIFSDQNGDMSPGQVPTLYPGETLHVRYKIKYVAQSLYGEKQIVPFLGSEDFIIFNPEFFSYISQPTVYTTNTQTHPVIKMFNVSRPNNRIRKQVSFEATNIKPHDEFIIDFDLQTALNLKDRVLNTVGKFPYYFNMTSFIQAYYNDSSSAQTYVRSLGWTQTEALSTTSKKQIDSHTYQVELTNKTKGSIFEQRIHNSMLIDSQNFKITHLSQVHTAKNPLVDYVDLSMNKGTQITTDGVASDAQLNMINTQLQSGTFSIDEIQQGDQIRITYEVK